MKLGIVGLPNVGKGTLFNAVANAGAESANYPLCTIDLNVGVVAVPDHRLDALTEIYHPKKTTPAMMEFADIVDLVEGVSKDRGSGNKFLANIQECDAIVHVVHYFDDKNIVHVVADTSTSVPVDPAEDIDVIDIRLIMADVEMVECRTDRAQKAAKGDEKCLREVEVFSTLKDWLNDGNSARSFDCDGDDTTIIATTELLSLKPIIYTANLDEEGFVDCHANAYYKVVEELATKEGTRAIPVCAKLEVEITELDGEEKKVFLDGLGIVESSLDRLIKASYAPLSLISFLIPGEDKCRAWTIRRGTKTPQATDRIHTDFGRGFIRAEVISFDDLMAYGFMNAAKKKSLVCSEGEEHVMKDGDIVLLRFNI